MKKLALALGIFLGASSIQPASAAVIKQTGLSVDSPPFLTVSQSYFSGFDGSLGMLNSVQVNIDWLFTGTTFLPATSYAGSVWNPTVSLSNGLALFGGGAQSLSIVGNGAINPFSGGPGTPVYAHAVADVTFNVPFELALFTQNSKIFDLSSLPPRLGTTTSMIPPAATVTMDVAYNYTPASTVPEPGAWLMMALGVGFVGWSARKRIGAITPTRLPTSA